jgi:pilus assembly protein CpaE
MTILWDTDPVAVQTYRFAIGDRVQLLETGPLVTRTLAADRRELLVVVGPDIDSQHACDLAAQLRLERPEVGVVLLCRRLDVAVMAQALRSGIREVVPAEDLTAIAAACRRSLELSAALAGSGAGTTTRNGRIVTVFSGKGGVGKTMVATNLGAYLASTGSRVLLVDLDLAFGDVAISLRLVPSRSASNLIAMSGHIDAQALASVVTRHNSGLDTLCAPDTPAEGDLIPPETTAEVLRIARGMYDFVIVDAPPAFTEHVLDAFDVTDVSILVATLDTPAVKNLRLTLDTLDLLGYPRHARVIVLNRSDVNVGLRTADVEAVFRQSIAVCIPSSLDVRASINRGVAIVVDEPKHPVSVALRALANGHVRPNRAAVKSTPRATGSDEPQSGISRRGLRQLGRRSIREGSPTRRL